MAGGAPRGPFSRRIARRAARGALLFLAGLLLSAVTRPTAGEETEPKGNGFLGGLRGALSLKSSEDLWNSAREMKSASGAVPLMENLLSREKEPEPAARAGLWLGHYYYGGGRTRDALGYFEEALRIAEDPATRAEAAFWTTQCRGLLDLIEPQATSLPVAEAFPSTPALLTAVAHGDALVRRGDPLGALRSYLTLEGEARRLGCLGPLYYRVALVIAAASSAGGRGELARWDTVESWEPRVACAPERALVASLRFEKSSVVPHLTAHARGEASPASRFAEGQADSLVAEPIPSGRAPADALGETAGQTGGDYVIQIGAYRDEGRARSEVERLTARGLAVRLERGVDRDGAQVFRIRLGRERTREDAERMARRLLGDVPYEIFRVRP